MVPMRTLSTFLFLLAWSWLGAQSDIFFEETPQRRGNFSAAITDRVPLLANPGKNSEIITPIFFTEELEHLGREAFVKKDRLNYIYVETADGNRGWVDDQFVVRGGGPAVLIADAPLYTKPGTFSTATGLRFSAGELVILSDWKDNWVYVTGENKRKFGWIEDYNRLSTLSSDIEIGGKIRRAMMIPNPNDRIIALRDIGNTPSFMGSPLREVVRELALRLEQGEIPSEGELFLSEGFPEARPGPSVSGQAVPGGDSFDFDGSSGDRGNEGPTIKVVTDLETGEEYRMVVETGGIQPVEAKNPPSIYYAYHKTVPVGDRILLELPYVQDGRRYLPLTVVAKLRPNNPNVVGLGPEVIEKVFGVSQASAAPKVTISYPEF